MKRLLFIFSIIIFSTTVKAQDSIPQSNFHLGVGVGQQYGIFGLKALVGINNSGFVVGVGHFDGMVTYNVGAQVAIKNIYLNLNYGVIGSQQINNRPSELIEAASFMIGGMIGFGKKKLPFLDIALGHSFGAPETRIGRSVYSNNTVVLSIGIGYRFPNGKYK